MKTNLITLAAMVIATILGQSLSAQVPTDSLTNGLVAYYPLDGNANDASGHSINGVLHNVSPTSDRHGNSTGAVKFLGTNFSYIDFGAPAALQFRGDFTVTAWVNFSGGAAGNPRVLSYGADCGYELLTVESEFSRHFGVNLGCVKFSADATYAESEWHFVAVRHSQKLVGLTTVHTANMFVNGNFTATNTVNPPSFSGNLNLGRKSLLDPFETRTYWGGAIDDVRFYNRALSASELNALYLLAPVITDQQRLLRIVPTPPGLVGWWPGDGNANDLAGGNTGILVNASTVPGYVGQAFAFSGQNSYVQVARSPVIDAITNALTLEAWVWHEATGATIQRYVTLTPDKALIFYTDNGPIKFELHFPDGLNVPLVSNMPVAPRTWYHVVGTYDGKEQRLYVNGKRVGFAVINRPIGYLPGTEVYISHAGQPMNGLIDEPAIYNRALTEEEIQSHFAAGSAGMAKVPVLSPIGVFFPGNARFSIRWQAGKAVTIQSSSNLLDWVTLTTDPNLTGTVDVTDSAAGAFRNRFYRAVSK